MARSLHIVKYKNLLTMKLFAAYQKMKKRSLDLLAKGLIDEYFELLVRISQIEKQLIQLRYLN